VNTFATIVRLSDFQYEKVRYYSIRFEENEVNEFYDFLNRMEDLDEVTEDLSNLLVWIEQIGEKYGAIKNRFFRNESITADVQALPPGRKQMVAFELPVESLRLYCLVLNEHVVFLFNGGVKSTQNAKECPNVGHYIKQANLIVRKIDEHFRLGNITWNYDQTDIQIVKSLEIEI